MAVGALVLASVMTPGAAWRPVTAAGGAIEPGLLAATAGQSMVSLIVRLDGPSVAQLDRQHREGQAASGGSPLSHGARQALRDAVAGRQAPAAAAIDAVGATVVARYQGIINGFLVHATPGQVPALAHVPGVVSVARAPMLRAPDAAPAAPTDGVGEPARTAEPLTTAAPAAVGPATSQSVPWIGAPKVWALGYRGDKSLVAVLDTGVDYTHAAFGGPGTEQAYRDNNENLVEPGTFPNTRTVGGYDLAGQRYSPHPSCGAPDAGAQQCSRTAQPDDDPLDVRGNGTAVAGVIAGQRTDTLSEGVAPGALLVPLKIFGNPVRAPVVTDLLVGAFDWVVNNNLGLDVGGYPTEPVDVVFIGLTDDWLSGTTETERVVQEASDAGLIVVVAFGNNGPYPYLASAVASAGPAVSVTASYPPGQHGLLYDGRWTEGGAARQAEGLAIDSQIVGQPDAWPAGFQGPLAWMGTGCSDVLPVQPVTGTVALVARGDCGFPEKMTNAQAAGATAVVVFTTESLPVQPMGGEATVTIPGVMIDFAAGTTLREALVAGAAVTMVVSEPAEDLLGDVLSTFNNRGPSRATAGVKPQLAAPGQFIVTAWPGATVSRQTGTSVAAAHVAGTAALLAQRNKARKLRLEAPEVAALALNYAAPTVKIERHDVGRLAPVTLQGAGRVDAYAAAVGNTVVRSDTGVAELSFGHLHAASAPVQATRTLYVRNLSAAAKAYQPQVQLLDPAGDAVAGVSLAFEPARLTVPAGGKATIQVTLTADPATMRPFVLRGLEAVANADVLDALQVDGWLYLQEVDAGGAAVAGGDRPGVPFVVLPYRHACVASATTEPFFLHALGDEDPQWWYNACPEAGIVRVYPRVGTDPDEANLPPGLDIQSVGMRHYLANPDDPESDVIMEFAVQTRGSRRIPSDVELRVYIDLDRDGTFDHVAWPEYATDLGTGVDAGRWMVIHAPLEPGSLEPDVESFEGFATYMPYDLDETVSRLMISAEDLGLDLRGGSELFDIGVAAVDVRGDYPLVDGQPVADYLPDGLANGEGVTYDQLIHDCVGSLPEIQIAGGGGSVVVPLTMACETPAANQPLALMFNYAGNLPDGGQLAVRQGLLSARATAENVYLPYAYK